MCAKYLNRKVCVLECLYICGYTFDHLLTNIVKHVKNPLVLKSSYISQNRKYRLCYHKVWSWTSFHSIFLFVSSVNMIFTCFADMIWIFYWTLTFQMLGECVHKMKTPALTNRYHCILGMKIHSLSVISGPNTGGLSISFWICASEKITGPRIQQYIKSSM